MENNVLILSVGRRVELVKLFQNAIKMTSNQGKVIGVDIEKSAPALYFCDKYYIIDRISSIDYISNLLEICKKEKIRLIIPTIDTELLKLAENRKYFDEKGILLNLSDIKVIKLCRDKRKTSQWLQNNGFYTPQIINESEVEHFPLFIKPLDGSSSINAFKINNSNELHFFSRYINNPIIQEFIDGEEYTIDVFCDLSSKVISIVPRKRVAVRSGEVLKGIICKNPLLIKETKKLIEKLKPIGHITIQCFIKENKIYYLEINPRYGGGAPMSIMAGANTPLMWMKILENEVLTYNEDYRDDVLFSRFDQSIEI